MAANRGVAFITGMARGQGRAEAVRLAQDGFDIIGIDICAPVPTINYEASTEDDLDETIKLVEKQNRGILARPVDTRDLAAMQQVIDDGIAQFGSLDVVVANAAVSGAGKLWELTDEQWDTMISVILKGTWNTIRATIPRMIAQGTGGSVILIGSLSGMKGIPFCGHYNTAKHGIVGMCRTLANEVGIYDIRVNAVHPGHVDTPLAGPGNEYIGMIEDPAVAAHVGPQFISALPQAVMSPDDIADVVSFFASDGSRNLTGVQVPVDRGVTVR